MFSNEYIGAMGQAIYNAAVAGSKKGYSRTNDDYTVYEQILSEQFDYLMEVSSRSEHRKMTRQTKGNWKRTYLPISFLMEHEHYETKEIHARVMLLDRFNTIIDIPLKRWRWLENEHKYRMENSGSNR
jgi:hypothetical protein